MKITMYVSLVIPDNIAYTAFTALPKLGITQVASITRADYYEFEVDHDIADQLKQCDILVNANKHDVFFRRQDIPRSPKQTFVNVLVKDKQQDLGLLNTLKTRLGLPIKSMQKGTLWGIGFSSPLPGKEKMENVRMITEELLCNSHYQEYNLVEEAPDKKILVIFGSDSDKLIYDPIVERLEHADLRIYSAYRTPELIDQVLQNSEEQYALVIAGAGLAAHLPGVVASKTCLPIIGVPVGGNYGGVDALLSIAQMPPGIPVLSSGVDCSDQVIKAAQYICQKPTKVNLLGNIESKAAEKCKTILGKANITPLFLETPQEGAININFLDLGDEPPKQGLLIHVPLGTEKREGRPEDTLTFLKQSKTGLWVGLNRGENAAIAALEILGEFDHVRALREARRKKILMINSKGKEKPESLTYKDAGVDIDAGERAVDLMKAHAQKTFNEATLSDLGSFGGLFKFDKNAYEEPVLVASCDGVGTKLKLAYKTKIHDTVGQDLVNHCVNDILVQGAKPLFFMDYIGTSYLNPFVASEIVKGMAQSCKENNCVLIGGETAELPGLYKKGEYDLVASVVGVVEKKKLVTGDAIEEDNIVIGLASNGLHTNGYSLAQKIFFDVKGHKVDDFIPELGCTVQEALMKVHTNYFPAINRFMDLVDVKGMAHITGGGLINNVSRIIPKGLRVQIKKETIDVLPLFRFLQEQGNVPEDDMWKTFNMGVGYVVIVAEKDVQQTLSLLGEHQAKIIGKVIKEMPEEQVKEAKGTKGYGNMELIKEQLAYTFDKTDFPALGTKYGGKVRDNYTKEDQRVIVVTDKVSAFDRVLCKIPFKGQVLNAMAKFWFEQTKDIVANHMVSTPDPNVMIVKEAKEIPVEMVVRGYITGVTTTSAWYNYHEKGVRNFCGNPLPEGLKKNQKFDHPIITPSTKAVKGDHDESVSAEECVQRGLVTKELMDKLCDISMKLFLRGREIAAKQGIILVDTKYEFGLIGDEIVLIDEIHTPDSSRFWFANEYEQRFAEGREQKKIDKEYIREWLAQQGFIGDGPVPMITDEVKTESARRYIEAYELITGQKLDLVVGDPLPRIAKNLEPYMV